MEEVGYGSLEESFFLFLGAGELGYVQRRYFEMLSKTKWLWDNILWARYCPSDFQVKNSSFYLLHSFCILPYITCICFCIVFLVGFSFILG